MKSFKRNSPAHASPIHKPKSYNGHTLQPRLYSSPRKYSAPKIGIPVVNTNQPIIGRKISKGWINNEFKISKQTKDTVVNILKIMVKLYTEGLTGEKGGEQKFFDMLINSTNLFIKEKDLPPNAKIINPSAFDITS